MNCHLEKENYVFQQIGHLLSTSHELSMNILRNLGYRDLVAASKVCSLWFSVSRFILNKERRLRYTVIHPQGIPTTESTATLESHPDPKDALYDFLQHTNYNKPSYCLVFVNGEWLFRKDIHACLNPKVSTLSMLMASAVPPYCQLSLICASGVIGSIEALKPKPVDGLLDIISSSVTAENSKRDDETNYRTSPNCNEITDTLFSKSIVTNAGITDADLKEKVGYSIEIEEEMMFDAGIGKAENLDGISIIMFPRLQGIKMNVQYLDKEEFFKKYRPKSLPQKNIVISDVEFNSIFNLEPNEELKAMLLFYTDNNFTEAFVNAAVLRQNQNLALGGGLVRAVQQKGDIQITGQIAVTFSGNNVKAFSIIIPPSVKNESELMLHFIKLKEHYIPEAQTICFMFACCGRGQLWYQGNKINSSGQFNNMESRIFRKFFPNVPLFGFFGEGEVGLNHLPVDHEDDVPKKRRKKRIFHQFTSIFVLISIL